MAAFITRMKTYREKLNLNQSELANKVGVRRETIVRLERGQYNPSLKLALDISKVFNVAVEDVFLFDEEKEKRPQTMFVIIADTNGKSQEIKTQILGIYDQMEDAEKIYQRMLQEGYASLVQEVVVNRNYKIVRKSLEDINVFECAEKMPSIDGNNGK